MCGRYGFVPGEDIWRRYDLAPPAGGFTFAGRYNIVPGNKMPVVVSNKDRQLVLMKWGLIPHWAKDPQLGYRMINARAETLADKPAFRIPFARSRCLVTASFFYEWKKLPRDRIPFCIRPKNGKYISFAGIYDNWTDPKGQEISSYSIITVPPNSLLSSIHDRMPAILREEEEDIWISEEVSAGRLLSLLQPYQDDLLEVYPVSKRVNSPENDDASLITEVKTGIQSGLFEAV